MATISLKNITLLILKIIAWILGGLVVFILLIFLVLQIPKVQNYAARQGAGWLQNKLDTRVEIAGLTTDFRNSIVLKGVYLEDQQQDTLWYSERIGVDINLFALLRSEINVSSFVMSNATAHVYTTLPDTTSNYDFILDAFATDTTVATEPVDTTSQTAWKISVGTVTLEDIFLTMRDEVSGSNIRARIGTFVTEMDEMDLGRSIYRIDEIDLRDSYANYIQTKVAPPDTVESEPLEMDFGVNLVNVENVQLHYNNEVAGQKLDLDIGNTRLRAENIDLENARVDLQDFVIRDTDLAYMQRKYTPEDSLAINPKEAVEKLDEAVEEEQGQPMNWVVTLGQLDAQNLNLAMVNENEPRQPQGIDYNHLNFANVQVDIRDFFFSENRTTADIRQVQLQEQSGFRVEQFQTNLTYDSTQIEMANLNLETGESRIRQHLGMRYTSLDDLTNNIGNLVLNINLDGTSIGLGDALYFMPDLRENPAFRKVASNSLQIDGRVTGPVRDVTLQNLRMAGLQGTRLLVDGNLQGLPEVEHLYANVSLTEFATTRTDIKALAPAGTLPEGFQLPPNINLTGDFRGSLTNFDTEAALVTTYGNITADLQMRPKQGVHQGAYHGDIQVKNLDLGKILQQDTIYGQVSLQANIDGYGLSPEHIHAKVNARVQKAEYNGYQYNNVLIRGDAEHDMFTGFASMNDENLVFAFNGTVDMGPDLPLYNFTLDLDGADLQALNLYQDPLRVQGKIVADMRGSGLSNLAGTMAVRQLQLQGKDSQYQMDSMRVTLDNTPEHLDMQMQSDLLEASFTSGNNLEQLPEAINRYIDQYLRLPGADKRPAYDLQDFAFEIDIKDTELFRMLVPDLTAFEPGPITGSYTQNSKQLEIDAAIPRAVYAGMLFDSLNFRVRGGDEQLAYTMRLNEVADSSFQIKGISLTGAAQNDNLTVRLGIEGQDPDTEVLALGGVVQRLEEVYRFRFQEDDVILDAQPWTVSPDNFLQFGDGQIYANNIRLEREGSRLSINSIGNLGDDGLPMEVAFNQFDLAYIVNAVQREDSLLTGQLNGQFRLVDVTKNFTFTADLGLENLTFQKIPVGNLTLLANNVIGNRYNLEMQLTGQGNQMTVEGYYLEQEVNNIINLNANISPLNLKSLEGFTAGMVKDMDGRATGRLSITGNLGDPDIRGRLYFNEATFTPTMLNTPFRLQEEALVFDEEGISFPNFTITDPKNNTAVITGQVLTQDYTDYAFNLNVRTNNFLAMNSTAQNSELYYGTLLIDSDTNISGGMELPVVRASVQLLEGTDVNVVMVDDEIGVESHEGVVVFVDKKNPTNQIMEVTADTTVTAISGMDVSATIEVTEGSQFTVIIDPISGDALQVRGNGVLNTGIDPSGTLSLSGRYEISEGSYQMTFYNLVSREFDIASGSSISWAGDPLDANMDLTAIYRTRTAPMELVADQIGGLEQTERNKYRQQLPFEVLLNMDGQLMEPEISFGIQLPEEERGALQGNVHLRLQMLEQEESELNKQVFALLVLGRFIAQDPLASSGGGLAGTARNSVSQVLSQQLSQLTDTYLGGLGLEVGVDSYEDFSTGSPEGRTELNLALQQELLNDRLIVRVGSNVDIEGDKRRQNNASQIVGNVVLEYLITPDGRLRLKGFRRQDYEGLLEGEVLETGLGLIFMREYNNFSELFQSIESRKRNANGSKGNELTK